MGNSGKVLMIFKGDYNASTTYQKLNVVYYNNRSYVCKQTSTGNAPTNTTYWQALTGDASAEIQALTNQLEDETKARATLGAHQLIPLSLDNLKLINTAGSWSGNVFTPTSAPNLTFTINSDMSITLNGNTTGVSTSVSFWLLYSEDPAFSTFSGCILSGNPAAAGEVILQLQEYTGNWQNYAITYDNNDVLIPTISTAKNRLHIQAFQNKTFSNVTVKPLIRVASDPSKDFTPYAKTNVELTQDVAVKKLTDYTPTAGTNVSIRSIDIYRSGNTISLLVYIDVTSDLANNAVVVSFDKSLPKPATLYALGMCKSLGGDIGQLQMHRNSSNQIQTWGALKAGSYYCAPITYLTTE